MIELSQLFIYVFVCRRVLQESAEITAEKYVMRAEISFNTKEEIHLHLFSFPKSFDVTVMTPC